MLLLRMSNTIIFILTVEEIERTTTNVDYVTFHINLIIFIYLDHGNISISSDDML